LANETDVDNPVSSLQISRVLSGSGGTAVLNGSGNVVFTPTANFNGTASFTYWVKDPLGLESNAATVTVNVAPVNDSPYAQDEVVSGASEDAVFHIDKGILLANDGDVEDSSSALSLVSVGNATNGSVSLDSSGNVVFTPATNFNGVASFQYAVRDTAGATSPTVTTQIQVAAVNDNPVAVDEGFNMYTNTPTSSSTATIGFNQLLSNDTDVDNPPGDLTVGGVRNAINGTAVIVGGQVTFTPTQNFNGMASFEYQVNDQHGGQTWATAVVNVAPPPNLYPSVNVTYLSGSYHVFGDPGGPVGGLPWKSASAMNCTVTRQTCKRNGHGRHFAKALRVRNAGGPRKTGVCRYEVCSNKNAHRHEFRKSLRRGQNILSHVHGVYEACFGG